MPIIFKRTVAAFTCFLYLFSTSLPAWGDVIAESAQDGNKVATEALTKFQAPQFDGKEITFGGAGGSSNIRIEDLFPGVKSTEDTSLESAFGEDDVTLKMGGEANARLKDEESMDGEAYRLIRGTASMVRPNIKNDPLWNNTDKIIANQDIFENEFADCSKETSVTPTEKTAHVPEMVTCERVNKPAGGCEIKHSIDVTAGPTDLFFIVDNSGSMESVIHSLKVNVRGVAKLLNSVNNDELRIGGAVSRGDQYTSNHIKLTKSIGSFESWIGSVGINSGQTYTFNAVHWAIANNDWRENVNKVIVVIGNQDSGSGTSPRSALVAGNYQTYIFHDNNEIKSIGTPVSNNFTAGGLYKVAQFLTVVKDNWGPDECIQAAKSSRDGFCTGDYSVTAGGGDCTNISGFDVCVGDPIYDKLSTPPIPDVPKMATNVSVSPLSCPFNEGKMECYTDAQGVEQCPENLPGSCVITHSINIQETPVVVKVAVEDTYEVFENNRVTIDLVKGTFQNSRPYRTDARVPQLKFDEMCTREADGSFKPHNFQLTSTSIWLNHAWAPNTLATGAVSVEAYPTCANGLKMILNIRDTQKGALNHFYAHEFHFKYVRFEAEKWGPDHCIKAAQDIASGACTEGKFQVTKGVESGCLPYKGSNICPGDGIFEAMMPSPVDGIYKLAQNIRVTGCTTENLRENTCTALEEKGCGFISTKCVGNAAGESGYCYVQEEVWDCGVDVPVDSATVDTSYQCDGEIRCLGTECYSPVDEKSSDFGYVAAALQVAQFAAHDMDCGEGDEAQGNLNCTVWAGEHYECKKAVGGWVDCCEAPDGVSFFDYMNLTYNTMKAATAMGALGETAQADGLFSYGTDLAIQGWNAAVSKIPWATAKNALTSEATAMAAKNGIIAQFQQELMNQVAQWTFEIFGEAAAGAMFSAAGSAGASAYTPGADAAFSNMLGGLLSGIMMVYMIYQIVNILVQIIWECEEREFELGSKKATKLCTHIGSYCASKSAFGCIEKRESYCCYNSPVGRIITEQAKPQLGMEYGEVENPDCGGLTIEDLQHIDWDKIDLTEWIGLMNMTGHYPTIAGVDLEKLTGKDATLSLNGDRINSADRNVERAKEVQAMEARKALEDGIRTGL